MFAILSVLLSASPGSLNLSTVAPDDTLVELVWQRSPGLQVSRSQIAAARGELENAQLLPNPAIDVSANTLPIGPTTPVGLSEPFANVPNYAVSVAELIELGKRAPRQQAARAGVKAVIFDARAQLTETFHDLLQAIGEVAAAQQRVSRLEALVQDAHKLSELQQVKADKGAAASLDADRALLEEQKLQTSLDEEQIRLLTNLRACSAVAGVPCEAFATVEQATQWLLLTHRGAAGSSLEQRADLQSLKATEDRGAALQALAEARAIPDPTVRVGYVRDQFVISGNQLNSLFVGVSVPLPIFDHGQADARAASVASATAQRTRDQRLAVAQRAAEQLALEDTRLAERRRRLNSKTLPLARSVVERLDAAVQRGGADIQDLLLARRTLGELALEAVELDVTVFRLDVERERNAGRLPNIPQELVIE